MDNVISAKRSKAASVAANCERLCAISNFFKPTIIEAQCCLRQESNKSVVKVLSWLSIGGSVVVFVLGLVFSYLTDSTAALATSLDAALDIFTSALVLWRFWGTVGRDEAKLNFREKRADVLIAGSFILLSFIISVDAIIHLSEADKLDNPELLIGYNIVLTIFFLLLGCAKMHVGRCLKSRSMRNDAWNSLFGGVMTFSVVIDGFLVQANSQVWYIDSIFALLVAAVLFIIGAVTLNRYNWWNRGFWHPDIPIESIRNGNTDHESSEFFRAKENPELSMEVI